MIEPETMITFFVFILSMTFIPAPDNTFVVFQSSLQGRIAGIIAALGVCTGLVVHSVAIVLGVATLLKTSDSLFFLLQWVGVIYLVYLAANTVFVQSQDIDKPKTTALTSVALFRRGLLITLLNPVVTLSMLLILPPFIDHGAASVSSQMSQLCGLMILAVLIAYTSFSVIADSVGKKWLHSVRAQQYLCYFSGCTIILFAGYLATANQNLFV